MTPAIDRYELLLDAGRACEIELPSIADLSELVGIQLSSSSRCVGARTPLLARAACGARQYESLLANETHGELVEIRWKHGELREFDHPPSAWEPGGALLKFVFRFKLMLAERGVEPAHAVFICRAFEEMLSNAQEHSRCVRRSLATFEVSERWWAFSVTDFGIGIASRLRENPRYAGARDLDAVEKALQHGVSTLEGEGRGFGFSQLFRALTRRNARLRIRSEHALVNGSGGDDGTGERVLLPKRYRRGTHVRAGARFGE